MQTIPHYYQVNHLYQNTRITYNNQCLTQFTTMIQAMIQLQCLLKILNNQCHSVNIVLKYLQRIQQKQLAVIRNWKRKIKRKLDSMIAEMQGERSAKMNIKISSTSTLVSSQSEIETARTHKRTKRIHETFKSNKNGVGDLCTVWVVGWKTNRIVPLIIEMKINNIIVRKFNLKLQKFDYWYESHFYYPSEIPF